MIKYWLVKGGELIKEARRRAGLSQTELAGRIGTGQSVIARWEAGHRSPAFETVVQAVRACGLELTVEIAAKDPDTSELIDEMLALTPQERLRYMTASAANAARLVEKARIAGRA